MSEGGAYGRAARARGEATWADVAVPNIEHEDRLAEGPAQEKWNDIFRLFHSTGEAAQREAKLAVYAYYAVNGTSKRTKHSRDINTGGGVSVLSADVLDVIGEEHIRQFMRSRADEGYSALKESGVLELDEVFVHKAMEKGVPRGYMHCAVDYLRGCSLFTPEEKIYAERHFAYSIQRARAARGGVTVDEEDARARSGVVSAQTERSRVRATPSGDEF